MKRSLNFYRDRIDYSKNKISDLKWNTTILVTGYFALISIAYLIWYNQTEFFIRLFLIFFFIYLTYKIYKKIDLNLEKITNINKKIEKDFKILLK